MLGGGSKAPGVEISDECRGEHFSEFIVRKSEDCDLAHPGNRRESPFDIFNQDGVTSGGHCGVSAT
jgi:hypothetical protein